MLLINYIIYFSDNSFLSLFVPAMELCGWDLLGKDGDGMLFMGSVDLGD